MTAKLVLFACTKNAGRSQIANAFFNQLADPAKARSIAAGLDPIERVHEEVVEVMLEIGHDLAGVHPVALTGLMLTELDFLVTLGCAERCPAVPLSRRQDWRLRDPFGLPIDQVRTIRDEIRGLVSELIRDKGWESDNQPHTVSLRPHDDDRRKQHE